MAMAAAPSPLDAPRSAAEPGSAAEEPAVPVLDIAPFLEALRAAEPGAAPARDQLPEAARAVASRWREAFSAQGFAQVVGHGVPDAVIEDAYACGKRFFTLPSEEKRRCDLGKGYGAGGYTAQGVERVSATASNADGSALLGAARARPPDRVESFVVLRSPDDRFPEAVAGFEAAILRYHDELTRLLRSLMRLTACSLELPLDYFEPFFFGEGGVGPHRCIGGLALRMAYYPALKDDEEPLAGQLRYGEHTDYTGFTILWQDHNASGPQTAPPEQLRPPSGGLQVRMPDGSWADCPPVPGAFTINAGDLIQIWTNDVFLSNTHRVLNPPAGDRSDRLSLVFFTGPTDDTLVEALPTCHGKDRERKYAAITSGEHLARKLAASNK